MTPLSNAKVLLVAALLLGNVRGMQACTACGCSASGTDFGVLQSWGVHLLGLQYRLDRFDNGTTEAGLKSADYLHTVNLNGIWSPMDRWQLQAQVPFRTQVRLTGYQRQTRAGLSDTWLMGRYAIWRSDPDGANPEDSARVSGWVSVGGGVKLPTGSYRAEQDGKGLPINSQLGTGSVDFLAELRAQAGMERVAFQGEAAYRYNLANPENYRFGRQVSGAIDCRWFLPKSERRFGLLGGLYGEHFGRDNRGEYWRANTGGRGLFATAGAFGSTGPWSASLRYRHPLVQNYAEGLVQAQSPLDVSFIYGF
ncbi:MAG: hypothetical protein GC205_02290 [Bacteroidetes bacterium]|nr:hypothetical protein [Bacteroidota bacterium]